MWLEDYMPGKHVKIYGTRDYKIVFEYADIDIFGFEDKAQLAKMKYFLERVASHITLYEMYPFYNSRKVVQTWANDYYTNEKILYSVLKDFKKGKIAKDAYEEHKRFFESENAKLVENLKKFNSVLVKELNKEEEYNESIGLI